MDEEVVRIIPKPDVRLVLLVVSLISVIYLTAYPTVTLVVGSFYSKGMISIDNYLRAFYPRYTRAMTNSLIVALGSSIFATIAGIIFAFLTVRTDAPFKRLIQISVLIPFMTSPFVSALSWSLLGNPKPGFINLFFKKVLNTEQALFSIYGYPGVMLVLGLYATPFVFLFVAPSLQLMNPDLEEAAYASGSSKLGTVFRITLPLIAPSIIAGFILAFVNALEHISIPTVIGIPAGLQFYAPAIAFTVRHAIGMPFADRVALSSSLSVVLLALTVTLLLVQLWLVRRKEFFTVTGKGFRPRLIRLGRWRYLAVLGAIMYFLLSTVLPYGALVLVSFQEHLAVNIEMMKFTLSNYEFILFEYPITTLSFTNSMISAAIAATVGLGLSTLVAIVLVRTKVRGKAIVEALSWLPTATPSVVLGIMLARIYLRPPLVLYGTLWVLVIAYMTKYFPFGIKSVSSVLQKIHPEIEESSLTCGASFSTTFVKITLPLIIPGFIAGWTLLFISGFKELGSSIILASGPTTVVSTALWDFWDQGSWGPMTALSVLMTGFMIVTFLVIQKVLKVNILQTE